MGTSGAEHGGSRPQKPDFGDISPYIGLLRVRVPSCTFYKSVPEMAMGIHGIYMYLYIYIHTYIYIYIYQRTPERISTSHVLITLAHAFFRELSRECTDGNFSVPHDFLKVVKKMQDTEFRDYIGHDG